MYINIEYKLIKFAEFFKYFLIKHIRNFATIRT